MLDDFTLKRKVRWMRPTQRRSLYDRILILNEFSDWCSVKAVANSLGFSETKVRYHLKKYGVEIPSQNPRRDDIKVEEVVNFREANGWTIKKIADYYQCSETTIRRRLKEAEHND